MDFNKLKIASDTLTVVIQQHGAEICSVKDRQGTEFIWQAGSAWSRHAPVLFPIVGRLKNDTYFYEGNAYKLSQHGFARDKTFTPGDYGPDYCIYELMPDEETRKSYPFEFVFRIHYRVDGNTLTCRYEVINKGKKQMYFSVGAHPAFCCPLSKNEEFEDYCIEFEQHTLLQTGLSGGLRLNDKKVLPMEGKRVPLTESLFDNDALVFEKGQVNAVSLASSKTGRRVTVKCEKWPYFGVWSKKNNREFVCLEPWFGVADHEQTSQQLHEKEGIIALEAGGAFDCAFTITFA